MPVRCSPARHLERVKWKVLQGGGLRKKDRGLLVFLSGIPKGVSWGRSLSAPDVSAGGGRPISVKHTDRAIGLKAKSVLDK